MGFLVRYPSASARPDSQRGQRSRWKSHRGVDLDRGLLGEGTSVHAPAAQHVRFGVGQEAESVAGARAQKISEDERAARIEQRAYRAGLEVEDVRHVVALGGDIAV